MRRSIPVGICTLRNVFCGFAAVGKGGARIGLSCLVIVNTKRGGATCPPRLPALSEETPPRISYDPKMVPLSPPGDRCGEPPACFEGVFTQVVTVSSCLPVQKVGLRINVQVEA